MALRRRVSGTFVFFTLIFCLALPRRSMPRLPAGEFPRRTLRRLRLSGRDWTIDFSHARIDFKAVEASSSVRVELHPNLIVKRSKEPTASR